MFGFGKKSKPVALATNLPTPVEVSATKVTVPPVVTVRIPKVGDHVYWSPKRLECTVVSVGLLGFTFQGGEPVRKSKGIVPRWTVYTGFDHSFDDSTGAWIVGEGQKPKNVRGKVIMPDPVKVDLSAYGVH